VNGITVDKSRNGRPSCLIRQAWAEYLDLHGIDDRNISRFLPDELCAQLSYCKDDEARRLIVGTSK
jgi:hypothetical protein